MHDLPILQAIDSVQPESEKVRTLGTISRLLSYPGDHYLQLVELLYLLVQAELPEAAREVSDFGQYVEQCTEHELEEAYTRTFDVNPACALEIGWHLFGEDYMRGQFLVRMRRELAAYDIPESNELPDHLTHALAVIAAMSDEDARAFAHACVFPALHKMQSALDKTQAPYRHLIHCLIAVMEQYYGPSEPWGENDERLLRNADSFPGQNGPRPQGLKDPLRSYPNPGAVLSAQIEIVPLHLQYPVAPNGSAPSQAQCPEVEI